MSGLAKALLNFLFGPPPKKKVATRRRATTRQGQSRSIRDSGAGRSKRSKVEVLQGRAGRPPVPYWQLRGWRRVADNMYLGYFKTRIGRCHGVIKWSSEFNYGIYIHDVPSAILTGPHGACFTEVRPGKFRVHFAVQPRDINSVIFHLETLLQEAFKNG